MEKFHNVKNESLQIRHAKANEANTACIVQPKPSVRASFAQRAFIPEPVGSILSFTYISKQVLTCTNNKY